MKLLSNKNGKKQGKDSLQFFTQARGKSVDVFC